jgi:hypothetical protein
MGLLVLTAVSRLPSGTRHRVYVYDTTICMAVSEELFYPEDKNVKFLRNVGTRPLTYTASHSRHKVKLIKITFMC